MSDGPYMKGPDEEPIKLPNDLQKKLDEYNRNFEALNTFLGDESLTEAGVATDLRVERTKEMLSQALPIGVKTLIEICTYGKTDGVRLKAAIYLIDRSLGKDALNADEDAATALLRRLQGVVQTSDTE